MSLFVNPSLAYLFVVTATMLAISTILFPRTKWLKVGMVICLSGAGFELFNLQANPWALVVVALSPLLYYVATRQPGLRRILLFVTGIMIIFGSVFLFVDKNSMPTVHPLLLIVVSSFCAQYIWVATERRLSADGIRRGVDPNSMIGLVGTTTTFVEDVGLVEINGEICPACSDQPIPAGSAVRVLKCVGRVLVVKKVEKLSGK